MSQVILSFDQYLIKTIHKYLTNAMTPKEFEKFYRLKDFVPFIEKQTQRSKILF
jgi:hypothetical protein